MHAVPSLSTPAMLSAVTVHQLEELEDEVPMLVQSRNSEAHQQKIVGVSRGGAPY